MLQGSLYQSYLSKSWTVTVQQRVAFPCHAFLPVRPMRVWFHWSVWWDLATSPQYACGSWPHYVSDWGSRTEAFQNFVARHGTVLCAGKIQLFFHLEDPLVQNLSHYLSQCWPRSMSPYGITRPQSVKLDQMSEQHLHEVINSLRLSDAYMHICVSEISHHCFW